MSLSEISNVLWRERKLLDVLVFKLEEQRLVLASGRTRWLSRASAEVESILEQIKRVELERAVAVAGSAAKPGRSGTLLLCELAANTPAPWDGIFAEHRRALLLLVQEIDAMTKSNRGMLRRGQQAAREALASLGEIDLGTDDSSGPAPDRSPALRLVDKAP